MRQRGSWVGTTSSPAEVFGAKKFSDGPVARHGDVLPLPMPIDYGFAGEVYELNSRRSQKRVAKRRRDMQDAKDTVWALNHLAGFEDESKWPISIRNQAQAECMRRVKQCHAQRPPPIQRETGQEALRQLLRHKGDRGYSEVSDSPGQLAVFVRERLSLPRDQKQPVLLSTILPEKEQHRLECFEEEMMLSPEERAAVLEKGFQGDCYLDPQLANHPRKYHQFIADLYLAKLISFTVTPKVQVGAFVVTKKGNKQRLIIDARRTNKLFRTPPTTILGSMEAWGRLEVDGDENELFLAQEDVKDFFYRLGICKQLGEYFSLPKVDGKMLQECLGFLPEEFLHLSDQHHAPVYPHLSVLPMGFSWAFHLAHESHCHLSRLCLPETPMLRDRRVAPVLGERSGQHRSGMLVYADNCNHFSIDRDLVNYEQVIMRETLHANNLDTHDVMEGSNLAESLGIRINGISGAIQPTPTRDWRLDRALWALCVRPCISGEQLQVIIGHITVRALLHRGLMCILRHSYVFVEQSYTKKQRLWPSVAKEMAIVRALLPLGVMSMRAPWDPHPLCTDASLSGYAVMESVHGAQVAAEHGRHDERWRFRRQEGSKVAPRVQALSTADVFEDPRTVKPDFDGEISGDLEVEPLFPDVSKKFLQEEDWHLLWNSRMVHPEPIHLIEARSILAAVKHRARDLHRHGHRILVLNDNMGVVLSIQKGRSSNYGLLRLIRRISSHCLATGIRLQVRWIPSELNVSDGPSRQWEPERKKNHSMSRQRAKENSESVYQSNGEPVEQENEEPFPGPTSACSKEESFGLQMQRAKKNELERARPEGHDHSSKQEEGESKKEADETHDEAESVMWRDGASGIGECEGAAEEGLLSEARRVLRIRSHSQPGHQEGARTRRSAVRLLRSHVSQWGRMRRWSSPESCAGVCEARSYAGQGSFLASIPSYFEGLAQDGAIADTNAYVGVPQEQHQWAYASGGSSNYGPLQRTDILDLCQAGRNAESDAQRCGGEECSVFPPCHHLGTIREERSQQDRGVRRSAHPGRLKDERSRRHLGQVCSQEDQGRGRGQPSLGLLSSSVPEGVESVRGGAEDWRSGTFSVSEQTRRSIARSSTSSSTSSRNHAKREMGERCQCQNLRQARKIAAADQPIQPRTTAVRRKDPPQLQGLFLREEAGPATRSEGQVQGSFQDQKFLSLFGGVGNPAKFVASQGGVGYVVDLADSEKNDLGKPSKWNSLCARMDDFDLVGIDLPCNTWSRARRAPWWSRLPKPLRKTGQHIFGLPWLSPQDESKVLKANVMLRGAYKMIKKCLKAGKAGFLENPKNSMVWHTPQIQKLLQDPRVQLVFCDMCQYGTQWKKPTGLLIWGCNPVVFQRCSAKQHLCSRTHKPHLSLTGISGKKFLTAQAQVYSEEFSKHLMLTIQNSILPGPTPP